MYGYICIYTYISIYIYICVWHSNILAAQVGVRALAERTSQRKRNFRELRESRWPNWRSLSFGHPSQCCLQNAHRSLAGFEATWNGVYTLPAINLRLLNHWTYLLRLLV